VVILGIILLVVGLLLGIGVLTYLGIALIIIGLVLNFVPFGGVHRGPVRGRWY
jgi:hypothetical protein